MTTPLSLRQAVLNRLLVLYPLVENAQPEEQALLQQEIDTLEQKLYALDRNLVKVAPGMLANVQTNSSAQRDKNNNEQQASITATQALKKQRLTRKEIDFMLSQFGGQEYAASVNGWLSAQTEALNALSYFEQQSSTAQNFLSIHNPFNAQGATRDAILYGKYPEGCSTLAEFVEHQNAAAIAYSEKGDLSTLVTPLPLYREEHARELNAWLEIERNRFNTPERQVPSKLAAFLKTEFNRTLAARAWRKITRLAKVIDQRNQAEIDNQNFVWQPDAPLNFGRHPIENTESTNVMGAPAASAIPRFVDDQGKPYAHTQVLCWRYKKSNPEELGAMHLDRLTPNLMTIGMLYTDHDGVPTLVKPDFLTKQKHQLQLQINPETGDTLLLETSNEKKPEQFVHDDPLLANWYSYGLPEHFSNVNQVIKQHEGGVGFTDSRKMLTNSLDKVGLPVKSRMHEVLNGSAITGFYELAADYHYGFMLLPLGHGSVAIKNIASLPNVTTNGNPIATKQQLYAGQQNITLPRTLRQYTHECYLIRSNLYTSQQNMMQANAYKYEDMSRIHKLKYWVDYTTDFPATGKQRLNQLAKTELVQALDDLQQGIRKTQFRTNADNKLNNINDAGKYHIYKKQLQTATAFNDYNRWVEQGFEALNNKDILQRLKQWVEAQEELDDRDVNDSATQIISECEQIISSDISGFQYTPSLIQMNWQPPKTLTSGIESPYTPLLYDGLLGVLSMLTQSHRDDELYGKYLLPLVQGWLQADDIVSILKKLPLAYQDAELSFSADTANVEIDASKSNLVEKTSPLQGLLKTTHGITTNTFVRGPGAPALVEGILDLASMLLMVGYKENTQLQANVLMRVQVLQVSSLFGLDLRRHQQSVVDIMVYFTRTTNRLNPIRIANTDTLSTRAYGGDTWGTSNAITRFEGRVKTALFFWDKFKRISQFMGQMNKDAWADPTEEDYREAAYHVLKNANTVAGDAAALFGSPNMLRFLQQRLELPKGKILALLEKEITLSAKVGVQMTMGANAAPTLSQWLVGGSSKFTAGKLLGAWADRITFVSSAIACVQSANDALHSASLNREMDVIRNTVDIAGNAMIVAGAVLQSTFIMETLLGFAGFNFIPVVGQALFVGGLVITIGLIAWDYYWEHWGRAHFISDTFVVFDDTWKAMSRKPYFNEYLNVEYGASADIKDACKRIEDKYQNTLVDAFRLETIQETTAMNNAIEANFLLRLFKIDEAKLLPVPDVHHDVRWTNFNWLAGARFIENRDFLVDKNEEIRPDKVREVTDVNLDDIKLAYSIWNQPLPVGDITEEQQQDAKVALFEWVRNLKHIQQDYIKGEDTSLESAATAEIIWPALVNGHFPEGYTIADLAKAKFPFVSYEHRDQVVHQFLARWQTLTQIEGN